MYELNANCNILLQALLNGVSRKEQLIETVWHQRGMIVAENSYHQLVKLLRDRFSEIGLDPAQIKTIPRHGVLFQGEALALEPMAPKSQRRFQLRMLCLLLIGCAYLVAWRYQPLQPPVFRPLMQVGSRTVYVHVSTTTVDRTHLTQLVRSVAPSQPFIYYIKRGNAEWIAACPTQIALDTESCTSHLYYWP
ncbi:hypothetical protein THUN1379_02180 [Paludibacterium sp. THUN1379]|nr:hypothetical protein THUN1379_02180 [Paludibacterium sp. THUN1379]